MDVNTDDARQAEREARQASAVLLAKYGGECLARLRAGEELLTFVAAMGKLDHRAWAREAGEWATMLHSLIAQIEDTDLSEHTGGDGGAGVGASATKRLPTEEVIRDAAKARRTLLLRVERKDGAREDVEVEPYSIHEMRRERALFCWNVPHHHVERLALRRILYVLGTGGSFTPRYDVEFDGENE